MKYLIIGLGNVGRTLAEQLTDMGHDVIGVDTNEIRIDAVKDRISIAYILDASHIEGLSELPLDEVDTAIVAIGQSMEQSLRAVAALKELNIKRIYARAIDNIHRTILKAMNINCIFTPETYAARIFAAKFTENITEDLI